MARRKKPKVFYDVGGFQWPERSDYWRDDVEVVVAFLRAVQDGTVRVVDEDLAQRMMVRIRSIMSQR